jgi:hypothetical protein
MEKLRSFLNSTTGQVVGAFVALVTIAIGIRALISQFSGSEVEQMSRDRVMIDTVTGKPFEYTISIGDSVPVKAPSGGLTGVPAEMCFWTKDGQAKKNPTYVLMNSDIGETGPTFCPDCERLVVPMNPPPWTDSTPPPTRQEHHNQRTQAQQNN